MVGHSHACDLVQVGFHLIGHTYHATNVTAHSDHPRRRHYCHLQGHISGGKNNYPFDATLVGELIVAVLIICKSCQLII
jgi:hypothetical protein